MGIYAENNLDKDEFIIVEERVHWGVLIWPAIWITGLFLLSLWATSKVYEIPFIKTVRVMDTEIISKAMVAKIVRYIFLFFIFVKGYDLLKGALRLFDSELTVTNKKVIVKTGLFKTKVMETPILHINNVIIEQDIFGQLLDYGTLNIHTSSGSFYINSFTEPYECKAVIFEQAERIAKESIDRQAEAFIKVAEQDALMDGNGWDQKQIPPRRNGYNDDNY